MNLIERVKPTFSQLVLRSSSPKALYHVYTPPISSALKTALHGLILFLQPFTISSSSVFGVSQISLDVCNKSVLSIADSLFAELYKSYKQESWTNVNGRSVKWISEVPYSYGSVRHPPNNSWSPQLLLLKTLLEKELKVSFNSVLINIYCSLEEVISQNTVITIR